MWLEERNWRPTTIHGHGTTDDLGNFLFEIDEIPIVEGCWGIGPQFYVVGEDGSRIGEIPVNMQIVFAWLDETLAADVMGLPLVVQEPR